MMESYHTMEGTARSPEQLPPTPLHPLVIGGVWVTKTALLDALRNYLPTFTDIECCPDGNRFLLAIAAPPATSSNGRIA